MKNNPPQQGRRIVWLVRMLTILGLAMVIITTGLIGWTLARVRKERAQMTVEQEHLNAAAQSLRESATASRREIQNVLDETAVWPAGCPAVANFIELIRAQRDSHPDPSVQQPLTQMGRQAVRLTGIAQRASAWRTNYSVIWEDLQRQTTMSRVREQIRQLRGAVESLEGRRRLDDAKKFRQWRQATGEEAARLAAAILLEQSGQQSRDAADFKAQLAEFARVVELLGGEEAFDNLADLKDNKLRPALDRLQRSIGAFGTNTTQSAVLSPASIENLRLALFGNGQMDDGAKHDGLFALRRDALQLRRAREQLKNELAGVFQEIEAANASFAQSTQARTAELGQQMEHSLAAGWQRLLIFGGGCAALFLWLAWIISRDINAQVNALDYARAEAEEGRLTTQKLMREQQAATAELATAHQGLQASEQRFRRLSASAPIGIFLSDAQGLALYFNPHWLGITGLSLEECLGEGWQRALHPDDAVPMLAARRAAAEHGEEFNHEFRFVRPSGEARWVHARSVVIRSESGEITGYVGTTEDITVRRQSEELLRLQEAALRSAANVVVITDRKGDIVWTNPAFTKVTGYTAEEVLGKNPRVLKRGDRPSPYPATYYQDLWKTITNGAVWCGEFHNNRKDGTPLIEEATITPVQNERGRITHFVAVKQDITARKHAEEELVKAQKELLEVSRKAGMAEVATGVLHNVGNVLNSVNVTSNCLADGIRKSKAANLARVVALLREHEADLGDYLTRDEKGSQVPGYLAKLSEHIATENIKALKELAELQKHIDHIKDIVAMQQNFARVSGVSEVLNVTELVEDALRLNESSLAHHGVKIVKEFEPVPPIAVEKHKALQILVNLVTNAKQACNTAERDDKQMTIRVMSADNRVRISVSDNGVGIPPENLTRIFNHGFTTKKDGHGFGLHSGANSATELGGALSVQSDGPGKGATFTLELPLAAAAEKPLQTTGGQP